MVVGEFTVSNIHMEEDKRDEEGKQKNSTLDLDKFKADVAATAALADQVTRRPGAVVEAAASSKRLLKHEGACLQQQHDTRIHTWGVPATNTHLLRTHPPPRTHRASCLPAWRGC